jgi:hypothetical protein
MGEKGCDDHITKLYLQELKTYSRFRKMDVTDHHRQLKEVFHFDFDSIAEQNFAADPREHWINGDQAYRFTHNAKQAELIDGYLDQYGKSLDGLGRILMRVWPTKRLFREVTREPRFAVNV